MENTTRLGLPYLMQAQAQKHVTHNEALRILDAIVQASVVEAGISIPPSTPVEGDCYIPSVGATDVFENHDNEIAFYIDGAWQFFAPKPGWRVWDQTLTSFLIYSNGEWTSDVDNFTTLAINASADTTNRLTVRSPATLLDAETGDHRLKLNKFTESDTTSIVFQTGYTGHAEFGLVGDNTFRMKVSADGSNFSTALHIDETGHVSFPQNPAAPGILINGTFNANTRLTQDGAHPLGTFVRDRWEAGAPGATIQSNSNSITLTAGSLVQKVETDFWDIQPETTYTFSAELSGSNNLTVSLGMQSATLTPGSERQSATFTLPSTVDPTVALELAGENIEIKNAKLELGTVATAWKGRRADEETALMSRYCQIWKAPPLGAFCTLVHFSSNELRGLIRLTHLMRAAPMISLYNENQFRIVPSPGGFSLGYSAVDKGHVNLVASLNNPSTAGSAYLLRSAFSGSAAILLEAEL